MDVDATSTAFVMIPSMANIKIYKSQFFTFKNKSAICVCVCVNFMSTGRMFTQIKNVKKKTFIYFFIF